MFKKKMKFYRNISFLILFGLVLFCLFINILKIAKLNAPGIFDSDYGKQLELNFDIFEDGKFLETSTLPYTFSSSTQNKNIEIVTTLPSDKLIDKSFIYFRSSGYSIIAEVDNNEVYRFFEEGTKDYGGGYSHFINLPENSNSKQLKIKLFCPSNNPFAQTIFPIYIGSKGYLLIQAFDTTYESLFFGIIFIVFGIVFLGNIVFFNRSADNSYLLSLSLVLICLGSWVLFQSGARQIIGITNPALPMEISFFSMFALPFCLWFYISTNYDKIAEFKILKYSAFFILGLYVPITISSYLGVSYLSFLAFIGSLILLFTLLTLGISIKLYISGQKRLFSCILAILSILVSIIAEEVLLLLKINIGHISILHSGMAFTAIIFIYQSIGNLIEKYSEDNEAKLLKKLAYLDVVTLVENRNSYERFIEEESKDLNFLGIILADVNGLKLQNDRYGHKAGDELLKRFAKTLKEEMPFESRLFRVGGDEFVGIIENFSEKDFFSYIEDLKKQFLPSEKDCGMAIGAYYYIKENEESLSKAIDKTDKNMYYHKKNLKPLIHKSFLVDSLIR